MRALISTATFVLATLTQQTAPPLVHCKLSRMEQTWQGTCPGLAGQTPTIVLSSASSLKTGRYRKDVAPTSTYTGEMRIPDTTVSVELEFYADGTGILRPEGLLWLSASSPIVRGNQFDFDVDPSKTVPPSDLDRDIIIRAAAILSTEAAWDRADDRVCNPDDKTWSIYCSMIRATQEVTGGVHHRRPAMELVRLVVDERSAGRQYEHRLRDYNNDSRTTLADVQSLFKESLGRLKR